MTATRTARPTAQAHDVEQLAVCCLGPMVCFADGAEVPLRPGRARSLLQFLVVHRAARVPREAVMEAFWPGADPARARNSLNVAACELRRALRHVLADDVPLIERAGDGCRLNPALPWWVDAEELVRCVASGDAAARAGDRDAAARRYEEAADLYRGDLFSDDPYSDWIAAHRWTLQDAALRALDWLGAAHLAAGNTPAASEAARRVLQIAPDNEEAHRTLMLCHARLDRRSLALRQYRALADRLARLRVTPSPHCADLYERICRGEAV